MIQKYVPHPSAHRSSANACADSMTWGGLQGFQTPIANDSFIVDGVGALGTTHTERGLTYFEVELSGHMYVESCLQDCRN